MLNAKKITKILLISICFFGIFGSNNVAFAVASYDLSPIPVPTVDTVMTTMIWSADADNAICAFYPDGSSFGPMASGNGSDPTVYDDSGIAWKDELDSVEGTWTFLLSSLNDGLTCNNGNLAEYIASPQYISTLGTVVVGEMPPTLTSGVLFGRSGESQQAIQNPVNMVASVGVATSGVFSSVFPYLMLSAGVILVFYITQKLAMTVSLKTEKKRGWTAEGATEHEINRFKKKKRSRIKRGLPLE